MAHGHHDKKEAKLSKRIFLNINIVIFSTHKNQTFLNNTKLSVKENMWRSKISC